MASGAIYPILTRYLSLRQTAALAFALMGLGYAVISFTVSLPALGIGLLLAGFGFGFNQPNCVAWLLGRASPETRGRAAAGLTFAICLGQLVSPFLYDPLVSVLGSRATFGVVAGACMLVALAASSASQPSPLTDRIIRSILAGRHDARESVPISHSVAGMIFLGRGRSKSVMRPARNSSAVQ